MGAFYIGPMLHLNYSYLLPYLVPEVAGSSAGWLAVKKLMFDQLGFAPICTAGFFVFINMLEGHGPQKGFNEIRQNFWKTMLVNWQIWIPANFLNFRFVPIPYQVLFANGTATVYNACLSYIHNNLQDDDSKS